MGVATMTAADDALALLDDYLSAAMSDVHASDFEERLFAEAAAGRAPELGYLDTLFDQAQWFVMRGGFSSGATAEQIAELRKLPHVHYIDVEADTRVGAWPRTPNTSFTAWTSISGVTRTSTSRSSPPTASTENGSATSCTIPKTALSTARATRPSRRPPFV